MGDINRDPDLDRTPADPGSDPAEAEKARGAEASGATGKPSPLEPASVDDSVKKQDRAGQ
jgi:hypothetical protein